MKKYTIKTDNFSILEEDINLFLKDITQLDTIGYVLPHYFNKTNEITSYGSIIIETTDYIDLEYIKEVYKIEPNKIYSNGDVKHLVFDLDKGISKMDFTRIGKALSYIYGGTPINYHFFPEYKIITEYKNDKIDKNLKTFLLQFFFLIDNSSKVERVFSKNNFQEYTKTNKIQFTDILTNLRLPLTDCDFKRNIHLKFGYPFEFVKNYLQNDRKTLEFFNKNFELEFELESIQDTEKYTKDGVVIKEGGVFYSNTSGYYTLGEKGDPKIVTDFFIKVYYKIIKLDGTHTYIVSLINGITGQETDKIFWFNGTGKTPFSDYIQKHGNFHFKGGDSVIKDLHAEISNTKNIPSIKNIIGYGFQKEANIIIFKNGIWDLKEKVFTEKKEGEKYYFNYDFQGYFVTDAQGKEIELTVNDGVPSLDTSKVVNIDEAIEFLNTLYRDDSGRLLLYIAFGMMGYLLYGDQKDPFPFLFTRGLTGSGKTTFNKLLQRIWGIDRGGSTFSSSAFSIGVMLTYLIKFPFFLGEYRESVQQADQKKEMLRNVFDRKAQVKGRADQTTVSYNYYAMPIMDGEEMISDGAVRTRTIQKQFLKSHRIDGNFGEMVEKGGDILDGLLFTYLLRSNKDKYHESLKEGISYFTELTKETDPRIGDNYARVYAGCGALLKENINDPIKVLTKSLEFQKDDVKENGTSMQIIKAITKFLDSNPFNAVHRVGDNIIIVWNSLDEYVKKYRVQLSLGYDTYKEHIEGLGYKVGYLDAGDRMLYGVIVPISNIPKEFLINTEFYQANKAYINGIKE